MTFKNVNNNWQFPKNFQRIPIKIPKNLRIPQKKQRFWKYLIHCIALRGQKHFRAFYFLNLLEFYFCRDDGIVIAITFWQWFVEFVFKLLLIGLFARLGSNRELDHFSSLFVQLKTTLEFSGTFGIHRNMAATKVVPQLRWFFQTSI